MATRGSLSRASSAAAAAAPADVIRLDDPARLPLGITPGTILNIGPVVAGQRTGQNHFALQEARDGDAAVTAVSQLAIATGFEELPYFTGNPGDTAVQLRASVGGPTTAGSTYARCELREQDLTGADMAFDALTGTHRLHGRTRITHLPPNKPEVVFAQLHNGTTDRVALRTQLVTGTIRLRCRINGTSVTPELANPYVVGTEIEWLIEVVENTVNVYVALAGAALPNTPQISVASALASTGSASWYFKTGCYNQSATTDDLAAEYCAVELRDLYHWHTGWPTSSRFYPVAQHAPTHGPGAVDDLSALFVPWSNVAVAGGVASLDGTGKIPGSQLPAIALTDYLVPAPASQAAMLALTGQRGDWTTRTDLGTDWQLIGDDPTQLTNWRQMTYPASPVSSVNGRVGAVTGVQDTSGKDVAGGYAGLDANGRISPAEMALVSNPVRSGTVSASLVSDASTTAGNLINLILTGNVNLGLSAPTDHQVITYHLLASGAARTVTWDSSVIVPSGLKTTMSIPSGAVLVATLEYIGNRGTPKWLLTRAVLSDGAATPGPLGIIGRNARTSTDTNAVAAESAVLNLSVPVLAGRLYRVRSYCSGLYSATAGSVGNMFLRYTTDGSTPTVTSTELNQGSTALQVANSGYAVSVEGQYAPAVAGTLFVLLTKSGSNAVKAQGNALYPITLTVEDLGVDPGPTGSTFVS